MKKNNDKFMWNSGDIVETSKQVAQVTITPLYVACTDLGIRQRDYVVLKNSLTDKERGLLEVIAPETTNQYTLYIREMVKYLKKGNRLPKKYDFLISK